MAFEMVDVSDVRHVFKTPPRLSICICGKYKSVYCFFNQKASSELLLKEGKKIKLYYDRAEWEIGFEIVTNENDCCWTVRKNKNIVLSKFFYKYKIDPQEWVGRYDIIEHGRLFVIKLRKKMPLKKRTWGISSHAKSMEDRGERV